MTTQNSVATSSGSQIKSLRAQPLSTLKTAILSAHDQGAVLRRLNAIFDAPGYFKAEITDESKAQIFADFCKALAPYPDWAVQRAFDDWIGTMTRLPTAGDLVILASRQVQPIADEIAWREKMQAEADEAEAARKRARVTPEAAARIMMEVGMTPAAMAAVMRAPMASSIDQAQEIAGPQPHWSEGADLDDPRWAELHRARAENRINQQAAKA